MPADLLVEAHYADDADAMFKRASSFADMIEATRKISVYRGLPPFPMAEGRCYTTDIKIFGIFKCNDYKIRIENICQNTRRIVSSEFNEKIRSWRHTLEIRPTENGSVWLDRVVIDAGAMTPIVARYAQFMYLHRHKQRNAELIHSSLKKSCRPLSAQLPMFHPAD
jgi:ligand-binding SRPBCC domain-containing protein